MKWYRNLYLTESIRKEKKDIISRLEKNAGVPGVWVVTLASNGRDLLDFFSADYLLQPVLHGHCPVILALAKGSEEAQEVALDLVMRAYKKNGTFEIHRFLEQELLARSEEELSEEQQLRKELHIATDEEDLEKIYFEYPMERLKRRRFGFRKGTSR